MTPLGIALPYVTDGGGLVVKFRIGAEDVSGVVFFAPIDLSFATTYPLQVVDDDDDDDDDDDE